MSALLGERSEKGRGEDRVRSHNAGEAGVVMGAGVGVDVGVDAGAGAGAATTTATGLQYNTVLGISREKRLWHG